MWTISEIVRLNCSDLNVVEVDITVSVGVKNNLDDIHVIKDIKRTALQ